MVPDETTDRSVESAAVLARDSAISGKTGAGPEARGSPIFGSHFHWPSVTIT
jgi:hypothetical protein